MISGCLVKRTDIAGSDFTEQPRFERDRVSARIFADKIFIRILRKVLFVLREDKSTRFEVGNFLR